MLSKKEEYLDAMRHARKRFSSTQVRILACRQNYNCVGYECKGLKLLPSVWEVDHIIPLFHGGSNEESNLQVICPGCHSKKTQAEIVDFYDLQRKIKFGDAPIFAIQEKVEHEEQVFEKYEDFFNKFRYKKT